jgi:hypothetical protein
VDIVAAKAKNGIIGDPASDGYVSMSGTSMATPHVSGAAAVLAGEHPDWKADQLKAALMGSAKPTTGVSLFEQGAGRVDVARATESTVFASVGSFSLGTVQWPHSDDQPIAKPITYTNTGTAQVTLDLALDVTGPSTVPQGMFTVSPAQLTVPAGGRATATITTNTTLDGADGVYSGTLTATGTGQSVHTSFTVTREAESYNVTIKAIDLNGAPTDQYSYAFTDVDNPRSYGTYDESGTVVTRVPKGEFLLDAHVGTEVGQQYKHAEFVEPLVTITGDTSFVFDAREAEPVAFTVDKPNARTGYALYQFRRKTAYFDLSATSFIPNYDNFL